VDGRDTNLLSFDCLDDIAAGMRAMNAMISRSAILLDPAKIAFNGRFERAVRCAQNPNRRTFCALTELLEWLAEATTESDRARLESVLAR
jgi:hypothetical protein